MRRSKQRLQARLVLEMEGARRISFFSFFLFAAYPGPRGFLLFFIDKFCDMNRFFSFFFSLFGWHEALRAENLFSRLGASISASRRKFLN